MADHYDTSFWAKKVAGVQSDPLVSVRPSAVPPELITPPHPAPPYIEPTSTPSTVQSDFQAQLDKLAARKEKGMPLFLAALATPGAAISNMAQGTYEAWKQLPEKVDEAKKGKYDLDYWAGRVLDAMIGGSPGSQGSRVATSGPRSPFPKGEIVESLVGSTARKGPWYSFLYKTLSEGRAGKFDLGANPKAKSLLSMLRKAGVNEDELVGTGLTELLTNLGQERITLESVKDFVRKHPMQMPKVTTLAESAGVDLAPQYSPSTYPAFNLPGEVGAYREVLYHYPSKTGGSFESPHFEGAYAKDLMAHSRGHLRTLPNGKKAMHIDEAQSDLHQRGSVEGYTDFSKLPSVTKRLNEVEVEMQNHYVESPTYQGKVWYERALALEREYNSLMDEQRALKSKSIVPETPYKTSWHKLVIRDWMQRAIDEGAEGVSWTSAAQQAKRYNRLANKMEWSRTADGSYEITFTSPTGRTQAVYTTAQKIESDTSRNVARIIKDQEATGAKTGLVEGEFLVQAQLYEKIYDKDFVKFFKSEYGLEAKKIPGGKTEGLSSKYDIIPVDELTRKDLKVDYERADGYVDTFQRHFDEVATGAREGTIKAVQYKAERESWDIRDTMTNKSIGEGFGATAEEAIADRQKFILRDLNNWLLRRSEAEKRLKSDYLLVKKGETSPGQHEILSQVPFGKTHEEVIKNAEQHHGMEWTQDLGELWYVPLPESLKTKIRLEGQRISQNALQSLKQAYA
uniref:Uncharacterized protein n=1 Tax=viral metagenome TaxID=1070528 RepID=A0A6M3XPR9_9ZZZZ